MSIRDANAERVLQDGTSLNTREKNKTLSYLIRNFKSSPSYFEAQINDNVALTGMQITSDSSNSSSKINNTLKVIMKPDDILRVGDMIKWNEKNWLCITTEMFGDMYYIGNIELCKASLQMYLDGVLYEIPYIVASGSTGIDENKYMSTPIGKTVLKVSNNAITQNIKRNDIYKFTDKSNYKVLDIDEITEVGLLIIELEFSLEEQIIPEIPPIILNNAVYITGTQSIIRNDTENYSCVFKNNGIVYSDESIFYLTADDGISETNLAIITNQNSSLNSCSIKGLILGYVRLFVKNIVEDVVSEGLRIKIENLF